jgi:hypothetical protein
MLVYNFISSIIPNDIKAVIRAISTLPQYPTERRKLHSVSLTLYNPRRTTIDRPVIFFLPPNTFGVYDPT